MRKHAPSAWYYGDSDEGGLECATCDVDWPCAVALKQLERAHRLAQEIRRVDGNHDLGAAALAEALSPWIEEQVRRESEQLRQRAEQAEALASRLSKKRDDRYELAAEKKVALTALVEAERQLRTMSEAFDRMENKYLVEQRKRQEGEDYQAVARVKALHKRVFPDYGVPEDGDAACNHCRTDDGEFVEYPCVTIRALEGATDD